MHESTQNPDDHRSSPSSLKSTPGSASPRTAAPLSLGPNSPISFEGDGGVCDLDSPFIPRTHLSASPIASSSPVASSTSPLRASPHPSAEHLHFGTESELIEDDDTEEDEFDEMLSEDNQGSDIANIIPDSPFLSRVILLMSIFSHFLTAVDLWLTMQLRARPLHLFSAFLFGFLVLIFLLIPHPIPSSSSTSSSSTPGYNFPSSSSSSSSDWFPQKGDIQIIDPSTASPPSFPKNPDLLMLEIDRLQQRLHLVEEWQSQYHQQAHHSNQRIDSLRTVTESLIHEEWPRYQSHLDGQFALLRQDLQQQVALILDKQQQMDDLANSREALDVKALLASEKALLVLAMDERYKTLGAETLVLRQQLERSLAGHAEQFQLELESTKRDFAELIRQVAAVRFDEDSVVHKIEEIATRISLDLVDKPDFALHSAGARVVESLTSATYLNRKDRWGLLGKVIAFLSGGSIETSSPPENALSHDLVPGKCWAFAGHQANLTIQLASPILPKSVSLGHLPKSLALNQTRGSALAQFNVWGVIIDTPLRYVLLGSGTYSLDGEPVQTFPLEYPPLESPLRHVSLQILSNHGESAFTCLYRFSVHV